MCGAGRFAVCEAVLDRRLFRVCSVVGVLNGILVHRDHCDGSNIF